MNAELPPAAPDVVAAAVESLTSRLRKKLDAAIETYAAVPVTVDGGALRVRCGEDAEVILTPGPTGTVADAERAVCSCLLAPRCLHRAAVLSACPVADADADADGETEPGPSGTATGLHGSRGEAPSADGPQAAGAIGTPATGEPVEVGVPIAGTAPLHAVGATRAAGADPIGTTGAQGSDGSGSTSGTGRGESTTDAPRTTEAQPPPPPRSPPRPASGRRPRPCSPPESRRRERCRRRSCCGPRTPPGSPGCTAPRRPPCGSCAGCGAPVPGTTATGWPTWSPTCANCCSPPACCRRRTPSPPSSARPAAPTGRAAACGCTACAGSR